MLYVAPIQVCNSTFEQKLELAKQLKNIAIVSCWCLNVEDVSKLAELPHTIIINNKFDVIPEKENIASENLIYKHIIHLMSLYEHVSVLNSPVSIFPFKGNLKFLPNGGLLINKNETTYRFFKRLERHVAEEIGILEKISVDLCSLLLNFDAENTLKLICSNPKSI
jgi:hypothetical protein